LYQQLGSVQRENLAFDTKATGKNLPVDTKATGHNLAVDTKATGQNLSVDTKATETVYLDRTFLLIQKLLKQFIFQ
jgi:hypothetical protein